MTKAPDGRRRPPTGALPPTEPLTASQVRQNAAAKRMLRRLVQGENPPTAPMSIVDRLAGSPYANPMIQVGGVDASARKTIDFALHLAEVHVPLWRRRPGSGNQHHRDHRRPGPEKHRSGHHQPVGGHQLRPQGPDSHHPAACGAVLDQQLRGPGPGTPAGHGHRGRRRGPRRGSPPARRDYPQFQAVPSLDGHSGVRRVLGRLRRCARRRSRSLRRGLRFQPAGQPAGTATGQMAHPGLLHHRLVFLPGHTSSPCSCGGSAAW